jgi:glycosyltransferase involved in cell wall biosynthesis
VHFLLVGEEEAASEYLPLIQGTPAEGHVTFGGYRSDVPDILRSVYVGLRPTKDWDSFPVSCMEMAACGVPMVVSEVGGLPETIEDGVSGKVVPVGEYLPLADEIEGLLDDPERRESWSTAARQRILDHHAKDGFLDRLTNLVREVWEA